MKHKKLTEICELTRGTEPGSDSYNDKQEGVRFIRVADISKQKTDYIWTKSDDLIFCKKEDVLMSFDGSPGAVYRGIEGAISSGIRIVRPKSEIMNDFLFYVLQTNRVQSIVKKYTIGSSILHASKSIPFIEVPVPPLLIQRKIASILEKAESAKEKRQEANRLSDEFLKSTFLEMFGDPVRNPKHWKIMRIEKFCEKEKNAIKAGPFGSSLKKEFYTIKGYKIYGQEQVIRDNLSYGDYYISEEKYHELINYKIKEGDVLISLVGTYGKISIVPKKFELGIINPRLMKITLNQNIVLPLYFKFLLISQSMENKMALLSHGGTMGILNVGIIKKIDFLIPPIELQLKFADIVQKVEKLKEKQRESEKELSNLFNSLMQKAFKGELIQ